MNRIANKSIRLQEIETLLFTHPEGLTQRDLAQRLGVNRSTILRNLRDLQAPVYEENGRLFLNRRGDLIHLRLSLHEALSMHLAARMLALNIDRQNAHAASALRKMGQALKPLAPEFSRHILHSAEAIDEKSAYDNPTYMRVVEILAEGWALGKKVRVWHRKSPTAPVNSYVLSTYYIEPGPWGRSTYALGLREPPGELRTFKIERIEQAELLPEPYTVPADFDPFELLADAWSIWFTEEEPVEVVLKFSPAVAGRVMETRWHRSQRLEPLPGGGLVWRARVASTREMLPWIRGWGAEVEVLEPEELREGMKHEADKLVDLYRSGSDQKAGTVFHVDGVNE